MTCECELCRVTGRQMSARAHEIWSRNAAGLTPDECDVLRANWVLQSKPDLTCRHRGEFVRRVPCQTCGPQFTIKVYACAKHGECSLSDKPAGVAFCLLCPDKGA